MVPGRSVGRRSAPKPAAATGRIFYVDPAGSDTNAGTSAGAAWATLAKVNGATFLAGDIIALKSGATWRETLVPPRSNLRVTKYGTGNLPLISGADVISSWTAEGGGGSNENFLDGVGQQPVSYWAFAETTGTRLDSSPSSAGNALTASGTVSRVAGPGTGVGAQYAQSFSGGSFLSRANGSLSAAFPGKVANTSVTVGCWLNTTSTSDAGVMAVTDAWAIFIQNTSLCFTNLSGDQIDTGGTVPTNTWIHVVGRWNSATGETSMFVNGVKQGTTSTAAGMVVGSDNLRIGAHPYWGNLSGSVAAPFAFNQSLSDAQIAGIAAVGLGGSVGTGGPYFTTVTDWPANQVFRNGSVLGPVNSKGALVTGKHWYDRDNKRVYVYDNPSGATMEISRRNIAVLLNGVSNIVLDGIEASYARRHGIDLMGGASSNTVQNCTMSHSGDHGYAALTRSGDAALSDNAVLNCTAVNNGACGIVAGSNVPNWRAALNTAHHNGRNPNGGGISGNIILTSRGLIGRRAYPYVAPPNGAVAIATGASIQAAINANPNGTAFVLAAGTFNNQTFTPKTGNAFYGAPNGATVLNGNGTTQRAMESNSITGVGLYNLVFRNFVPPANTSGALGTGWGEANWILRHCEFSNPTAGMYIMQGNAWSVRDCYFHHNYNNPLGGFESNNSVVEYNEMAFCNLSNADPYTSDGNTAGYKFNQCTGTIIRCNYIHHTRGSPGFWTDGSYGGTVVEHNVCVDNDGPGIIIELDYGTICHDNFVARNGAGLGGPGGIYWQNSQNGTIYNNEVTNNYGGIWMFESDRGSGPQGPWLAQNNTLKDNLITGSIGSFGYGGTTSGTSRGNAWTRNSYYLTGSASRVMGSGGQPFSAWQAAGNDPFSGGIGGTNLSAAPAHTPITGYSPTRANGITIEDNVVYAAGLDLSEVAQVPGGGGRAQGIWVDRPGTGCAIRRNTAYNCLGAGVRLDNAGASSGAVVELNVAFGCGQGVMLYRSSGGATVKHNTAYNNRDNIWLSGEFGGETVGFAGNTVRDNIGFQANGGTNLAALFGANNAGTASTGNTYTKNALGAAAAGFAVWGYGGSQSTYAGLNTASGQTMNNVAGDPLFTNAGAGDFTLQAGSPCLAVASDGGNIGAK